MKTISYIIDDVIKTEGGYSDNPNDAGGKTMYGITERVARAAGYHGDMRQMPVGVAREIYMQRYVVEPKFNLVLALSLPIGIELVDTGVNCGTAIAAQFLQRALNAFNQQGALWPDLPVDGQIGQRTISALTEYIRRRKNEDGERVMLVALNSLQGARYIDLALNTPRNESFVYGWLRNRASIL